MSLFKNSFRVESARLKDWDYSEVGWYYVTIVLKDHRRIFGTIVDGSMKLNVKGEVVKAEWLALAERFTNITLYDYVIMPDHIHGIIVIEKQTEKTLSNMIGCFKSRTTNLIKQGKIWQERFWDRIIRGEKEFYFIAEYIKSLKRLSSINYVNNYFVDISEEFTKNLAVMYKNKPLSEAIPLITASLKDTLFFLFFKL